MDDYFSGKVALVTGGAIGMGYAGVEAVAGAGAAVILSDVNERAGKEGKEALRGKGDEVTFVRCNVADESDVAALVDATVATYGRLDAAFNNAGIMIDAVELPDVPTKDFDLVLDVNLRGVWNCMLGEGPRCRGR